MTRRRRTTVRALLTGAMALGLVTTATAAVHARAPRAVASPSTVGAASADADCSGSVSVYGALADGRLTYSQIDPPAATASRPT